MKGLRVVLQPQKKTVTLPLVAEIKVWLGHRASLSQLGYEKLLLRDRLSKQLNVILMQLHEVKAQLYHVIRTDLTEAAINLQSVTSGLGACWFLLRGKLR